MLGGGAGGPAGHSDPSPATIGAGAAVLAFDVGGTDIKSALFDAEGHRRALRRTPTPSGARRTPPAIADELARLADLIRREHPDAAPAAAGVLVPGIVDAERGVGVYASNMGWRDAPIADLARDALGLPVAFQHDVTAASWAEHRLGAARGARDAVVLVIGTGIAGSLILGGRMHTAGGYAGEIGHSPVADGPRCGCGALGCLEAVASASAIARRYAERTGEPLVPAEAVVRRAGEGDAVAAAVWDEALDALTLALAQLTAVVAPETIVIGGGLSRAGDALFVPLRARLDARLSFHRRPAVVPAELGGDAGVMGAALLAREAAS
jgi:glucokinase